MSGANRKEVVLRGLLEPTLPVSLPPGLVPRATARGVRLRRGRRAARAALWTVLATAAALFAVWAWAVHPWAVPPTDMTPPLEGW
ncbi:hypothetical protein ACWEJP_09260 [Streptomyces sp. NPDC004749]